MISLLLIAYCLLILSHDCCLPAPRPPADRPAVARDGARAGRVDADLRLTRRRWPLCASPACRRR